MRPYRYPILLTATVVLALTGCTDMHDQPSFKAQESPRLSAPREAVTVNGEMPSPGYGSKLENPVVADAKSLQRGELLYQINCAMCHGTRDTYLGSIGGQLKPPPPSLHDPRIRDLSESDIFLRIYLGFGRMPAQGRRISETDIWNLVNYVKTFD